MSHKRRRTSNGANQVCTLRVEFIEERQEWYVFVLGLEHFHAHDPTRREALAKMADLLEMRDRLTPERFREYLAEGSISLRMSLNLNPAFQRMRSELES